MKIEVTAKEIKNLYNELDGIEWLLKRQTEPASNNDYIYFGISISGVERAGSNGISLTTRNELRDELVEVTKKFLEKRKKEIVARFEELKLPIK